MSSKVRLFAVRAIKISLVVLPLCLVVFVLGRVERYQAIQGKWQLVELRGKSGDEILTRPGPQGTGFWIVGNWIKPYGHGCDEWGLGALLVLHGNPNEQCCDGRIVFPHLLGIYSTPTLLAFENDKLLIGIRGGGQHPRTLDLQNAPDGTRIWVLKRDR